MLGKLGNYDLGFKVAILLSFLILVNIITLLFTLQKFELLKWLAESRMQIAVIAVPIMVLNYFYFVYKERYKKIADTAIDSTAKYPSLPGIAYIIISVAFFFIVV